MYDDILEELIKIIIKISNKKENKEKMEVYIISPLIQLIWKNIKPFVILFSISVSSILFFLIAILLILMKNKTQIV